MVRVGPNLTGVLLRREKRQRHMRTAPNEDGSRGWSDAISK